MNVDIFSRFYIWYIYYCKETAGTRGIESPRSRSMIADVTKIESQQLVTATTGRERKQRQRIRERERVEETQLLTHDTSE